MYPLSSRRRTRRSFLQQSAGEQAVFPPDKASYRRVVGGRLSDPGGYIGTYGFVERPIFHLPFSIFFSSSKPQQNKHALSLVSFVRMQLSSFYTAITWAGTAVFHRERKASRQTFDRRQWTLVSLLSVCTALNTLVGRANIAVPTTFDQVWC